MPTVDLTTIDAACEAMRIVRPHHVGYASVLIKPLGWTDHWTADLPPLIPIETYRRYGHHLDRSRWTNPSDGGFTAPDLKDVGRILPRLQSAPAPVRLASRRLSMAANRDNVDDRTVDACIGFEALVGDDPSELTHRMSLRAAAVLASKASNPADPRKIYSLMKKIYKHRSQVVHGNQPDKFRTTVLDNGVTVSTASLACRILRELLWDWFDGPTDWTPASLDLLILERLGSLPIDASTDR